ncbi:MAG: hypothetical protein C4308_12310 [Chitinophagaceae bacterium]
MINDNKNRENEKKEKDLRPNTEALHTPDPQENMEGPVSSSMRKTGKAFDTDETRKEAEERKDRNL